MCVRVCDIEFVVFADCESCTRHISTNPVSMEASEHGLTRGTCFFARRLEVVAVEVDSVVCFGWGDFICFCFFSFFFSL